MNIADEMIYTFLILTYSYHPTSIYIFVYLTYLLNKYIFKKKNGNVNNYSKEFNNCMGAIII